MSDVWDSEPYQLARLQPAPTSAQAAEQGRRLNVVSSSRGRIHNAIQADNEFVVRELLRLGADATMEENQEGWTPLLCTRCFSMNLSAFARWSTGTHHTDISAH